MIFVKCLLFVAHAFVVRPGFRDHHHHYVGQGPSGQNQEFQAVVEHGRIASIRLDDRQHLRHVIPKEVRLEQ